MKSKYVLAALIGLICGIYILVSTAIVPIDSWNDSFHRIPFWDFHKYLRPIPPEAIALVMQAIALRLCGAIVENGFSLVIPIFLSCAFLKLSALGMRMFWVRTFIRSLKLTGLVLGFFYVLGWFFALINSLDQLAVQIIIVLCAIPRTFYLACVQGYVLPIWVISFGIEFYRLAYSWEEPTAALPDSNQ